MEDMFLVDEMLQDDEKLVRNTVRQYVDEKVIPVVGDAYEEGVFPEQFIKETAELGILGITLPEKYDCAASSYVTYGLVCQELERGDSGLRSFVSVQNSLCMYPIFRFGSEEQRGKYLSKMAKGELIGCFGLTEPDSGSDPASMRTTAKKVDSGWILNGAKMWITNAPIADIAIVWAKTDEGIRGFIVEKEFKGYRAIETKKKMSLRASCTGELILEDCFVPDDNFMTNSIRGLACPLSCLTQARFGIAWGTMGAAAECFDTVLDYTKNRTQFNKPLASFQLIQKDLVTMYNEITKGRLLNMQLGRLMDKGKASPVMVSMAKMNGCRQALNIARMARNALGANGISLEYSIIRHMTNLESVYTYEGTDNIHHLIVGKHLTGEQAFC